MKLKKIIYLAALPLLLLTGCNSSQTASNSPNLLEARQGFKSNLKPPQGSKEPIEQAPANIFRTLKYPSPVGELGAYLSPDPGDGKKHPAIIWITGGDCNSIGGVWASMSRSNEQTASAFRQSGVIMMFPSLRGGNDNPGTKEGFLGEVDDVLAAAAFLEKQPYVDPSRIYLGGHSTGGTMALLAAEASNKFRAVFSFGPIDDVAGYGANSEFLPFDVSNDKEVVLRSPLYFINSVQSPVWIIEGGSGSSNVDALRAMQKESQSSLTHFVAVEKADHFSVLGPINELLAAKVVQDTGTTTNISLTEDEANQHFAK